MSKCENNWQYCEQYPLETEFISKARRTSLECGIEPVSRATASFLSSLALNARAKSILELGTGVGVSGLSLLRHIDDAHLTSIDIEPEFHSLAKPIFADAGIASGRLRLIAGNAKHILPRFNKGSYDIVLIDADFENLIEYVEQGLLIVKPGGTIAIPHILNGARVANPAVRDEHTTSIRDLLSAVADAPAVVPSLLPVGDGLLTLTMK